MWPFKKKSKNNDEKMTRDDEKKILAYITKNYIKIGALERCPDPSCNEKMPQVLRMYMDVNHRLGLVCPSCEYFFTIGEIRNAHIIKEVIKEDKL